MTFQIVRIAPVHCQITDGLIGNEETWRSHAYETERLAQKLAGLYEANDYEACGDDGFKVVKFGESAFTQARYRQFWGDTALVDEIVDDEVFDPERRPHNENL